MATSILSIYEQRTRASKQEELWREHAEHLAEVGAAVTRYKDLLAELRAGLHDDAAELARIIFHAIVASISMNAWIASQRGSEDLREPLAPLMEELRACRDEAREWF